MAETVAKSLKPTWGNVLMLMDEPDEKIGMIVVPDMSKKPKLSGTIVQVGPGRVDPEGKIHESEYKPGDRVVIGQHIGYKVLLSGIDYKMVEERYIQCSLEDAEVRHYGDGSKISRSIQATL